MKLNVLRLIDDDAARLRIGALVVDVCVVVIACDRALPAIIDACRAVGGAGGGGGSGRYRRHLLRIVTHVASMWCRCRIDDDRIALLLSCCTRRLFTTTIALCVTVTAVRWPVV